MFHSCWSYVGRVHYSAVWPPQPLNLGDYCMNTVGDLHISLFLNKILVQFSLYLHKGLKAPFIHSWKRHVYVQCDNTLKLFPGADPEGGGRSTPLCAKYLKCHLNWPKNVEKILGGSPPTRCASSVFKSWSRPWFPYSEPYKWPPKVQNPEAFTSPLSSILFETVMTIFWQSKH